MFSTKEKILLFSMNLWCFSEGLLGPFFAVFGQKIGGSILQISWAWAAYLISLGIMTIFIGKISDHKNKKIIMILGYMLVAVFTFGYLTVKTPLHLLLIQAGIGAGSALALPTYMALYAKYEDKKHDGEAWGLNAGLTRVMAGIAIIIGGLIISKISFNILFSIMGTIQVIATLVLLKILK